MDKFNFKNKIVIITGGSCGMWKAIALGFEEARAIVVVAARKADLLEEVVKEIQARGGDGLYIRCDLSKDDDVFNLIKETVHLFGK
jgi:NAD(P)-dependent dehydrogenase (short-subunit alcohol dehydrogenase family)